MPSKAQVVILDHNTSKFQNLHNIACVEKVIFFAVNYNRAIVFWWPELWPQKGVGFNWTTWGLQGAGKMKLHTPKFCHDLWVQKWCHDLWV